MSLPEWSVGLPALAGYLVVMRWLLPRLGVPT